MRHALPAERIDGLPSGDEGLATGSVPGRRQRHGDNAILPGERRHGLQPLLDASADPMVWFLAAAALLYAVIGDRFEALVLTAALVPIIGLDLWLHRRTRASTGALADVIADTARVLRDGREQDIAAVELVVGDLVLLGPDQPVPADGVLVAADRLQVDEALLSGEPLPQAKQAMAACAPWPDSVDHAHWASAGTRVLDGHGRLRVVATGADTLYGELVRSAQAQPQARTPMQAAVRRLVALLLVAAVLLCLTLFAARWWQGFGLVDALVGAATLAVAALPEEFPVVLTLFLGLGVFRLARRRALVRRAVVVENIGRTTWLCSDKTGTLTEGRMRLVEAVPAPGVGRDALLEAAALASRTESGDPMDRAILHQRPRPDRDELARFPFTGERRRETAVFANPAGGAQAVTKGALETVLALSDTAPADREAILAQARRRLQDGQRLLACAARPAAGDDDEPASGFRFLGLLCFSDPLRPEARATVERARTLGLRLLVLTGDHALTAAAVAREAGIGDGEPVVCEGPDIDARLAARGASALDGIDAVARCLPATKAAVVTALRARGEVVAVTGDGVNDVPALAAADIGIAMGQRGTRSAREAASIVLLDDRLSSVVEAIAEGRRIDAGLRLAFAYLILVHLPFVLSAALLPLGGHPLFLLPLHIVWIELIIHPTAILAFQRIPAGRHDPPSRPVPDRVFGRRQWRTLLAVGLLATAAVGVGYLLPMAQGQPDDVARAAGLVLLVAFGSGIAAGLSGLATPASRWVVLASLASAPLLLAWPAAAALVHAAPPPAAAWLAGAALAVAAAAVGRRLRRGLHSR